MESRIIQIQNCAPIQCTVCIRNVKLSSKTFLSKLSSAKIMSGESTVILIVLTASKNVLKKI